MPEEQLETIELDGVDVLAAGGPYFGTGSPADGDYYTEDDLRAIAENTTRLMAAGELRAPLKLGHSVNQKLAKASGYEDGEMPALGWIDNPRVEGSKLKVDLKAVPKKLGSLLKSGAFRTRSLELRSYVSQKDGAKVGPAIRGLALMGAKTPAVRTLDDVIALYSDEVDEAEVQTREYGEVVWNPELGYRWVGAHLATAINTSGDRQYNVADVGPTTALVTSTGSGSWVVPFTITTDDTVVAASANEWISANDRWVAKAKEYAEASGDALSVDGADTSIKMGDEMTTDLQDEVEETEDEVETTESDVETIEVPKTEYADLVRNAEAGARAERKLAEMERDHFLAEAIEDGKFDPADLDDWKRRYDEQPEMVTEIVTSLKPQQVYLREFGSDSTGRDIEDDAERSLGDQMDDYMGVAVESRVIGGKA